MRVIYDFAFLILLTVFVWFASEHSARHELQLDDWPRFKRFLVAVAFVSGILAIAYRNLG